MLGVQPINALEPNTPNNQQQTNVFAIGPTLNFRMGPTVRGEAELRYINSYAEETDDFNTNRGSAALRAIKDLSASTTVSANITDELVDYNDNTVGQPDYSRYNVYGRYTRKWTKVDFVGDLGYSWLKYSGLLEDRDSPLARGALTWRYSDRSTFGLDFAYQYSDAATDMMTGADITTIPTNIATGEATTTSQPYLERRLGGSYFYAGERFGFNVAPYLPRTRLLGGRRSQPAAERRAEPDRQGREHRDELPLAAAAQHRSQRDRRESPLRQHRSRGRHMDGLDVPAPAMGPQLELARAIQLLQARQHRGRTECRSECHLFRHHLHALISGLQSVISCATRTARAIEIPC